MSLEISGKIIVLKDTETIGEKGFQKRLLVVQTIETYPQSIPIDFVQDRVDMLDYYKVNDEVKVSANLRGNQYQDKYFLNLQGWKISKLEEPTVATGSKQESAKATNVFEDDDSDDGNPF